jgi:hypothetical protein
MSDLYDKVEEYVKQCFTVDGKLTSRGKHLLRTKDCLLQICPEADEAMQIAAVSHDIDSAFQEFKAGGSFDDPDYLKWHQEGAAEVIGGFLETQVADAALIEKVKHLVICHEVGGDREQNIIKDADSLSFFGGDLANFISRHSSLGSTTEHLRGKLDWMYNRITSDKVKALAKPQYEEALKHLEQHENI